MAFPAGPITTRRKVDNAISSDMVSSLALKLAYHRVCGVLFNLECFRSYKTQVAKISLLHQILFSESFMRFIMFLYSSPVNKAVRKALNLPPIEDIHIPSQYHIEMLSKRAFRAQTNSRLLDHQKQMLDYIQHLPTPTPKTLEIPKGAGKTGAILNNDFKPIVISPSDDYHIKRLALGQLTDAQRTILANIKVETLDEVHQRSYGPISGKVDMECDSVLNLVEHNREHFLKQMKGNKK